MANFHSEIDHLYVTLNANTSARLRKGSLSALDSLSGVSELDSAGVYFLFEPGEVRHSGEPRVVRVGKTNNLRRRLQEHRGNNPSAFFTLIWEALMYRDKRVDFYPFSRKTWSAIPNPPQQDMRAFEQAIVKPYATLFEFTWIPIEDERLRNKLELWATVVLSNYWRQSAPIDPPNANWLGKNLPTSRTHPGLSPNLLNTYNKVIKSGLWSDEFVDLDLTDGCCWDFEHLVRQ